MAISTPIIYNDLDNKILYSNIKPSGAYATSDTNISGPIIDFRNCGYATLANATGDTNTLIIPQSDRVSVKNQEHRLINAAYINWCGASVNFTYPGTTVATTYVINTTDDLIDFINDSYKFPKLDTTEYVDNNTLKDYVEKEVGLGTTYNTIINVLSAKFNSATANYVTDSIEIIGYGVTAP